GLHAPASRDRAGAGRIGDGRHARIAGCASMTDSFDEDGFAVLPAMVEDAGLAGIEAAMARHSGVGARDLLDEPWCADLARRLLADARLAGAIPRTHVPVQCTSFEKSLERNWLGAVHQDVAIPVAARIDHPALSGWSNKAGMWFVQPPASVL